MKIKAFFIMTLTLLAALYGVAQEAIVVVEGASKNYFVTEHPGNTYQWEVFTQFGPDVAAAPGAYAFKTDASRSAVEIKWIEPGFYYLKVTEIDINGCTNAKAMAIRVRAESRNVAFANQFGGDCYAKGNNAFTISLSILEENALPVGEDSFPLTLHFNVNDTEHTQVVEYTNQVLNISDSWFNITPEITNNVVVTLESATDAEGLALPVDEVEHTHSIFSTPQIAFVNADVLVNQGTEIQHRVNIVEGNENGAKYFWSVQPADGSSTDLKTYRSNPATILWDGAPGLYSLRAFIMDGNSCRSADIRQQIEIIEYANNRVRFSQKFPSTVTCSQLADGSIGSNPAESKSVFRIENPQADGLASAQIIVKNPKGQYTDLEGNVLEDQTDPLITVDNPDPTKHLDIQVNDRWENTTADSVHFEVKLVSQTLTDGQVLYAAEGSSTRKISVLPKPHTKLLTTPEQVPLNAPMSFVAQSNAAYTYQWWYEDASGNRTDLTSDNASTEVLQWNVAGEYSIFVQAKDSNNCISEVKSSTFNISSGIAHLQVDAGTDTIIGICDDFILSAKVEKGNATTFSWEPAEKLDDAHSATPTFIPGQSTQFVVTARDNNGQMATDTIMVTVAELVANAGEDIMKENASSVILDASASIGKNLNCNWTTKGGNIETGANTPNPIVTQTGMYYLTVQDEFGCTAVDSVQVSLITYAPLALDDVDTTVYQTTVSIDVLANDEDNGSEMNVSSLSVVNHPEHGSVSINYADNTMVYSPDNGFTGNDVFEYQICNYANQCDNANVYVFVSAIEFFIPQAFTPNGDNINDYFQIKGIEAYPANKLTVINRWGKKVYEANEYGISTTPKFWDGRSNQTGGNAELPTGTYFYVLDLGNGQKPIAGSVYIDR